MKTIEVDAKLWSDTNARIGDLEQQNAAMARTLRAIAMRECDASEAARMALVGAESATTHEEQACRLLRKHGGLLARQLEKTIVEPLVLNSEIEANIRAASEVKAWLRAEKRKSENGAAVQLTSESQAAGECSDV
jgi:hypothetical protein